MIISAVIDRIEDGNIFLMSYDMGLEISIPAETLTGKYHKGDILSLTLDRDLSI